MNPLVSVIIPTYNRSDRLQHCLGALLSQQAPSARIEVIVVDDGSTDDTARCMERFVQQGDVSYYRQVNAGPARARNVGIRAARGDLLLFLGDDIIASEKLVEEHVQAHRRWLGRPTAVLGFTDWSPEIEVTPLMQYPGIQFGYHKIEQGMVNPEDLPYQFFYTSNVSLPRAFVVDGGFFFDEDFRSAMGEDGELAFRMQQHGLRIVYHPRALAYHEHPTDFDKARDRFFLMGQVSVLQVAKSPGMGDLDWLQMGPGARTKTKHRIRRWMARALWPILRLVDAWRWDIQRLRLVGLYRFVFKVSRTDGQLAALRDRVDNGKGG